MSKALSVDLRERVVAAVAAGASCRAAAVRFGVSASSAIRWCVQSRKVGTVAPGPLGGDRRSARIEAHAPLILDLIEQRSDITLAEIQAVQAFYDSPAGRKSMAVVAQDLPQLMQPLMQGLNAEMPRMQARVEAALKRLADEGIALRPPQPGR